MALGILERWAHFLTRWEWTSPGPGPPLCLLSRQLLCTLSGKLFLSGIVERQVDSLQTHLIFMTPLGTTFPIHHPFYRWNT